MIKKGVIIGTFVNKNRILCFLELLRYKFKINWEKMYVYDIQDNQKEYLVTFKAFDKDKFVKELPGSTVMHVKNNCLFSINALNRLIEENYNFTEEKPYNEIEINWDEYKDKLIILTNGSLNIKTISKIDDKSHFLI